jgi:hypothetical protein
MFTRPELLLCTGTYSQKGVRLSRSLEWQISEPAKVGTPSATLTRERIHWAIQLQNCRIKYVSVILSELFSTTYQIRRDRVINFAPTWTKKKTKKKLKSWWKMRGISGHITLWITRAMRAFVNRHGVKLRTTGYHTSFIKLNVSAAGAALAV